MNIFKIIFSITAIGLILSSCGASRMARELNKTLDAESYKQHFIGLMVYDPATQDTIYKQNDDLYFTPASNVKIFTLHTALEIMGDSLPLFKYEIKSDSITLIGTGSPLLLHPHFKDSTAIKLASQYEYVQLMIDNFEDDKYAPGWAWEDYGYYFSPERSGFPIYGNIVTIRNENGLEVIPEFFKNSTAYSSETGRDYSTNYFKYNQTNTREVNIPFITDTTTIKSLWKDVIGKEVKFVSDYSEDGRKIVYSEIAADSLYQKMMYESDNFLAEQMLVMSSSVLSDTLNTNNLRKRILDDNLKNMKMKPRWVDGSGLSRYNLFTPSSFIYVLDQLYQKHPKDRLFNLFPAGGRDGTLTDWYKGKSSPYVFAKSGTLGNNYNLSGYLVTNSGKVLIFSLMNNHFLRSTNSVKQGVQNVLEQLRDNY